MSGDRNFDDLVHRFKDNIYDSPKGRIRLAILQDDLQSALAQYPVSTPLHVLDAGCGMGHMALYLAEQGHDIVLCDHSAKMLERAKQLFLQYGITTNTKFVHAPVQELPQDLNEKFDLVLFHAVLEWLAEPLATLEALIDLIKPGGLLSIMFYNRNSFIMRNMLQGNFRKIISGDYRGHPRSLTPNNPLQPDEVYEWLDQLGLKIMSSSGVRILYDYLKPDIREQRSFEDLLDMERRYCRQEPYRSLGRYIHVIAAKD